MTSCSLHIGLNSVDSNHYSGWSGPLNGCEADMATMGQIATDAGFREVQYLPTEKATRANVLNAIEKAAEVVMPDEMFLITYSGHGGKKPDITEPNDRGDDETWCLFDGELLDDELLLGWTGFVEKAKVLIVSDSCHSGGMDRFAVAQADIQGRSGTDILVRQAPPSVMRNTYHDNRAFYQQLQVQTREAMGGLSEDQFEKSMRASAILLAACHDYQLSYENPFGGFFTNALSEVWDFGRFSGNYSTFNDRISGKIEGPQDPQIKLLGNLANAFVREKPLSFQ